MNNIIRKIKRLILKYLNLFLLIVYLFDISFFGDKRNYNSQNKIILVSNDSSNFGAPILLEYIACELKKRKFDLIILTRRFGPMIKKFKKIGTTRFFFSKRGFKKIISFYFNKGFKKIILNTTVNGDLVKISNDISLSEIVLVHEMPYVINKLEILDRAKQIAIHSKNIVFPSKYVYNKYPIEISNLNAVKIIPQGLHLTKQKTNLDIYNKEFLIEKYKLKAGAKIVINVANGIYRKGFDIFIDICNKLENENIIFVWIGQINRKILKKKMDDYQKKKIKNLFFTGFIEDSNELTAFYKHSDLLLLTSREDPYPSVVLQAFDSKTPVIGFKDSGGFSDIVIDNKTGFLVQKENIKEMTDKLIQVIKNENLLMNLSTNAKKQVKQMKFENYIDNLLNLYKSH